jgi:hypothetical protein
MTFPKKGSRTIVVDDKTYLWLVRTYDDDNDMTEYKEVMAQLEGGGETHKRRYAGEVAVTPSMVADVIRGVDTPGKYNQTLADGTEVEVEVVPINRKLIEAGAVLPESERREPTAKEKEDDANRANAMFAELSEPPHPNEVLEVINGVLDSNDILKHNDEKRDTLALRLEVALRPFTRARFDG